MGLQSDGGPEQSARRPTLVTALGWLVLAVATLDVLLNAGILAFFLSVRAVALQDIRASSPAMEGGPVLDEVRWVVYFVPPAAAFSVALGCCAAFAAVYFLKLRPWARTLLEGTAWAGLGYLVVCGLAVGTLILVLLQRHPPEYELPRVLWFLAVAVPAFGPSLVYGVPVTVVIRLLRSKAVREAMTK